MKMQKSYDISRYGGIANGSSNPMYFVGITTMELGVEKVRRVPVAIMVAQDDVLEIEVEGGLFLRMARKRDLAFGAEPTAAKVAPNRAERRRQERMLTKAVRLIELE